MVETRLKKGPDRKDSKRGWISKTKRIGKETRKGKDKYGTH